MGKDENNEGDMYILYKFIKVVTFWQMGLRDKVWKYHFLLYVFCIVLNFFKEHIGFLLSFLETKFEENFFLSDISISVTLIK